ncbi:MAG TPA: hypothetical protein VMF03_07380 [Steroidobacteraceae bacterium]|nr:hypothetical protein [Steroidobacteraceae bacterium]
MNASDLKPTEPSADRLERALRAALQPADPGPAFTIALQARLMTGGARPPVAAPSRAVPRQLRVYHGVLAVAAAIVVAMGIAAQIEELRGAQRAALARAQQERVHSQLLMALEITGERLGLAQQRIAQFQAQEQNP